MGAFGVISTFAGRVVSKAPGKEAKAAGAAMQVVGTGMVMLGGAHSYTEDQLEKQADPDGDPAKGDPPPEKHDPMEAN